MATDTSKNVDPEILYLRGGLFQEIDPVMAYGPLIDITAAPPAPRAPVPVSVERTPVSGTRATPASVERTASRVERTASRVERTASPSPRAPLPASMERTAISWPVRAPRARSARKASWVVGGAAAALLLGGIAAASQISSVVRRAPVPPPAVDEAVTAMDAGAPLVTPGIDPDIDPEPAAAVTSTEPAPEARPTVAAAPPVVAAAPPIVAAALPVVAPAPHAAAPSLPEAGAPGAQRTEAPPRATAMPLLPVTTFHSPMEGLGAEGGEFSAPAASLAIASAARYASGCTVVKDPRVSMHVRVTFAPSGQAISAAVTSGPFLGTDVGRCIAGALRSARVHPFEGQPVNVTASIRLH